MKNFIMLFLAVWLGTLAADYTRSALLYFSFAEITQGVSLPSLDALAPDSSEPVGISSAEAPTRAAQPPQGGEHRVKASIPPTDPQERLASLQRTCDYWTRRYPETNDPQHKVHRDTACQQVRAFQQSAAGAAPARPGTAVIQSESKTIIYDPEQ